MRSHIPETPNIAYFRAEFGLDVFEGADRMLDCYNIVNMSAVGVDLALNDSLRDYNPAAELAVAGLGNSVKARAVEGYDFYRRGDTDHRVTAVNFEDPRLLVGAAGLVVVRRGLNSAGLYIPQRNGRFFGSLAARESQSVAA